MRHEYKVSSSDLSDIRPHIEGIKLQSCLYELYNELRKRAKYNNDGVGSWEEAYELFNDVINNSGIDIFE